MQPQVNEEKADLAGATTASDQAGAAQGASSSVASADATAAGAATSGAEMDTASTGATTATDATADAATAPNLDAGTDGTYEENGIYKVTVRYVDGSGNQIAPSFQQELAEGSAWSATSPTVEGYQLADSTQAVVSGTMEGSDHNPVITVSYTNVLCPYQVVTELQVGDDYRVARTVEHTAAAGTKVSVAPEASTATTW